jgi:transposase
MNGIERLRVEQENEVSERPRRRRFTAEYKREVLKKADACTAPGELGELLRKEGLYSSHLASWRRAREKGELAGLEPKKRGPAAKQPDPRDRRIADLEREVARATARAERAEALVELQKKVAEILGKELPESKGKR